MTLGGKLDGKKWSRSEYVNGQVADWRRYQSRDEELVVMNGNSTVSLVSGCARIRSLLRMVKKSLG